jgi:hypothetical protein
MVSRAVGAGMRGAVGNRPSLEASDWRFGADLAPSRATTITMFPFVVQLG